MNRVSNLSILVAVLLVASGCDNSPPAAHSAERVGLEFCDESLPAVRVSTGEFVDALKAGDSDRAEEAMVRVNAAARCSSPRQLFAEYDALVERAEGDPGLELAPPLLLLLDAGARIIDDRGYRWMLENRDRLLQSLGDTASESPLRAQHFYRSAGGYIIRIPELRLRRLLSAPGNSGWLGRFCSIADLVWDDLTEGLICPRDECPVVREGLGLSPNEEIPEEFREVCEELADTFAGSAAPGPKVEACFDNYRRTQPGSHLLCVVDVWRSNRPIDDFLNPKPDISVEVSEMCQLGTNVTGEEMERQRKERELRKKVADLEAEQRRLKELKDEYERILQDDTPRQERWEARINRAEVTLKQIENEEHLRDAQKELDEFLEKQKQKECQIGDPFCIPGGYDCSPDDPWCTDSCGARDPILQQLYACYAPEPADLIGSEPGPSDPVDPRVVKPLPGSVTANPEFAALTDCLNRALTPANEASETSCSSCLRCADGRSPSRDPDGLCTCGGGEQLPEQDRCEQAIDCSPDGPCECPGVGSVPTGEPGVPVDPRVLFSVDSEEPICVGLWTGTPVVTGGTESP